MLRSLKALALFWTVFGSYGLAWLLGRVLPERLYDQLLRRAHVKNARRLAEGFMRLRGVFIKMGQVLSVLGTFLPRAYSQALEKLQDQVPPRPFPELEGRLQAALGDAPLERFRSFDREPLAAASLAQVHRAVTQDGRAVAVKVLYPGIERLIQRDLAVLRSVTPMLKWFFPIARFERVVDQLEAMLAHETDYSHEQANMERLRALFADRSDVVVPTLLEELCGPGVLCMSFEEGIKISDVKALRAAGIEPKQVGKLLVECFGRMLFDHRLFHADPHPGNFLVRPGPTLIILDYGAVEELTAPLAEGMKLVVLGAMTRDDLQVLRGLETMGFVAEGGDKELLIRVGKEYLSVLQGVRIEDFSKVDRDTIEQLSGFQQTRGQLREIMKSVEYPQGYFYVERTLALLFGLVARLAPKQGLPGLILPYAAKAFARDMAAASAPPSAVEPSPQGP